MKRVICYLLFLITFPACVNASSAYGVQFGLGVSATSGLNVILGFHNPEHESFWLRHFGVRLDVATSDPLNSAINSVIDYYMKDGTDVGDGVKIDNGKLDAWHTMALIDYYPFGAWWRISGGYAIGSALLSSDVFGTIEQAPSNRFYFYLAGDHYYYNGNNFGGSAQIDWDYHGPYIGTGVDLGLFCGFSLFLDLGVVYASRAANLTLDIPQEQLYVYNSTTQTWVPVTIPQLDADVARAEREADDKLSKWRLFPMVKVGFAYRF